MSVTFLQSPARYVASSIAVSPPPTTTTFWPRKSAPSHTAQALTPLFLSLSSLGEPEVVGARAGRDDDGLREVEHVLVLADPDLEGALEKSTFCTSAVMISVPWCSACSRNARHQLLAGHRLGEARVVLDVGREHELAAGDEPAGVEALDAERLQVGAGGVDGRGEPGGARADDDDLVDAGFVMA